MELPDTSVMFGKADFERKVVEIGLKFDTGTFVEKMEAINSAFQQGMIGINELRDSFAEMGIFFYKNKYDRMHRSKKKTTWLNRQSRHRGRRTK